MGYETRLLDGFRHGVFVGLTGDMRRLKLMREILEKASESDDSDADRN